MIWCLANKEANKAIREPLPQHFMCQEDAMGEAMPPPLQKFGDTGCEICGRTRESHLRGTQRQVYGSTMFGKAKLRIDALWQGRSIDPPCGSITMALRISASVPAPVRSGYDRMWDTSWQEGIHFLRLVSQL